MILHELYFYFLKNARLQFDWDIRIWISCTNYYYKCPNETHVHIFLHIKAPGWASFSAFVLKQKNYMGVD